MAETAHPGTNAPLGSSDQVIPLDNPVSTEKSRWTRTLKQTVGFSVALVAGLLSGLLIYFIAFCIFGLPSGALGPAFVFVFLFGGWALSSYILIRKAKSISHIISRGFLLGAGEWFVMIWAVNILAGRAYSATVAEVGHSDAAITGALVGGGLVGAASTAYSIGMVVVCLLGYTITRLIGREF